MYYITKAFEPIQNDYCTSHYRSNFSTPVLIDYAARFLPRYENVPTVRTIKASYFFDAVEQQVLRKLARTQARTDSYLSLTGAAQVFTGRRHRRKKDDWVRFLDPVVICLNRYEKTEIQKPKRLGYELVELKNSGTHREFLIREAATGGLVTWGDLPDVRTVREYLTVHEFPEDTYYRMEQFLDNVANGRGEILLCVEKRETAEFVLNLYLCHALSGAAERKSLVFSASCSNKCKEVNEEWMKQYKEN